MCSDRIQANRVNIFNDMLRRAMGFYMTHRSHVVGIIIVLIAAIIALNWLGEPVERKHLIHPDEGRYAEIPREMWITGDWITPRINGIKFFDKPPLQYWATATAYQLLGDKVDPEFKTAV